MRRRLTCRTRGLQQWRSRCSSLQSLCFSALPCSLPVIAAASFQMRCKAPNDQLCNAQLIIRCFLRFTQVQQHRLALQFAASCVLQRRVATLAAQLARFQVFKQVSTIIMYNDHHDHLAYKLHVPMLVGGVDLRVYLRLSGIAKLML